MSRLLGKILILVFILWGGVFSAKSASLISTNQNREIPPLQRSVSRQFVVYGTQRGLVSYVMKRADKLADRWNRLFRFSPISQTPIIIRFLEKPSPNRVSFETNLFLDDNNHLKVQLDVFDSEEVRNLEFDWRIFQALALCHAYSTSPPALHKTYNQPPYWIIDAATQDLLNAEEGDLAQLYAGALEVTQNFDLKAYLSEKPLTMDVVSRAIYRVKALSLLQSLIELPKGMINLQIFLSTPTDWDEKSSSLMICFPELNRNMNSLAKSWRANLMRPTTAQKTLPLRMNETAQRLNALLFSSPPERIKNLKMVIGPEAIPLIATVPKYKYFLRRKAEDLMLLSFRGHPLYRPLIDEYRNIIETLLQNPRKNLDKRIEMAEKMRWTLNKRCMDIEEYMNWFEAVALANPAHPFQAVLENDQRRRAQSWRSDPLSQVLDTIESAGW